VITVDKPTVNHGGTPARRQINFQEWLPLGVLVVGWLIMYGPSYYHLSQTIWASDEQGHGPIILGVAVWLLFRKRDEFIALPREPKILLPGILLIVGIAAYAVGRVSAVFPDVHDPLAGRLGVGGDIAAQISCVCHCLQHLVSSRVSGGALWGDPNGRAIPAAGG
jgi:hypothetical protein